MKRLFTILIVILLMSNTFATEATPLHTDSANVATTPAGSALSALAPEIKNMTDPGYLLDLANVHLKYNDFDRAEPLLRKALDNANDSAQKLNLTQALASCLTRKGDMKGAAEQFQSAIALARTPVEKAHFSLALADAYLHSGDPERAEKIVLEVSRPESARPDEQSIQKSVRRLLDEIWHAKPALVDAFITDAEATLAKNAWDLFTLEELVEIYSNFKHDPAKAAEYAEKATAAKPDDRNALFRLAAAYQQSGDVDKLAEVYRKLMAAPNIRRDEAHVLAFQAGSMMLQAGKKDYAIGWMAENFSKDPTSREQLMLATFYEQAKMMPDAEETIKRAVQIGKTPDEKISAKLRLSELALRNKDYEKAAATANAVAVEFKDNSSAQARVTALLKRIELEKNRALATGAKTTDPRLDPKSIDAIPTPNSAKDVAPAASK